jgi:hypothetical protein
MIFFPPTGDLFDWVGCGRFGSEEVKRLFHSIFAASTD